MKTVFHTMIDGHDIVQGFGDANGFIDPVATAQKLGEAVAQLPECVTMNNLKSQVISLRSQAQLLGGKIVAAQQANDTATANSLIAQANGFNAQAAALEPDLVAAIAAFDAKRAALFEANAVYTSPPAYESLIADDAAAPLQAAYAALGPGLALEMAGTTVPDLRGKTYWTTDGKTWTSTLISLMGQAAPANSTEDSALTDAQRTQIAAQVEAARVAALSPSDAAAEADAATQSLLAQAAQMRSELEIQGDAAALTKSQAWYATQTAAVASKYNLASATLSAAVSATPATSA